MKTVKCLIEFPTFVYITNGRVVSFPGRKVNEKFKIMDMHKNVYSLLEKNNFITEVL